MLAFVDDPYQSAPGLEPHAIWIGGIGHDPPRLVRNADNYLADFLVCGHDMGYARAVEKHGKRPAVWAIPWIV